MCGGWDGGAAGFSRATACGRRNGTPFRRSQPASTPHLVIPHSGAAILGQTPGFWGRFRRTVSAALASHARAAATVAARAAVEMIVAIAVVPLQFTSLLVVHATPDLAPLMTSLNSIWAID